jgi:hypothetical protein
MKGILFILIVIGAIFLGISVTQILTVASPFLIGLHSTLIILNIIWIIINLMTLSRL